MFKKILVAVDESDHSKKALAAAGDLAEALKSEVRVVHVRETPLGMGGSLTEPESNPEALSVVDDAVKSLVDRGVTASGELRHTHRGRVAAEIIGGAEDFGATAIVVGSRGMTELAGLIIGSVTHRILHLSNLPVIVIR